MQKRKCRRIVRKAAAAFIAAGVLVAGCRKMPVVQKEKSKNEIMEKVPTRADQIYNYSFDGYKFKIDVMKRRLDIEINGKKKKIDMSVGPFPELYKINKGLYALRSLSMGVELIIIKGNNVKINNYIAPALMMDGRFIDYGDAVLGISADETGIVGNVFPKKGLESDKLFPNQIRLYKFEREKKEKPYIDNITVSGSILRIKLKPPFQLIGEDREGESIEIELPKR